MDKIELGTPEGTAENIGKIAELFPQVMTEVENGEGALERTVDFDALRDLLGDVAEGQRERYQFTWPGKREAKAEARRPIYKTMIPEPGKSKDWDTTENLYIEGDNLDALKILKETYAGKVKLIYIDPPYNTGSDKFVYPDSYRQSAQSYAESDGEIDNLGNRLVENKESNGRFHSCWCSMLYQRLLLLRDLMAADGLIAVSINDAELINLGKLMDEVFGSSNRLACAPWRSEPSGGKDKTALRTGHEYIMFYSKNAPSLRLQTISDGELNLEDSYGPYRKGRELRKWGATSDRADRPNMWFGIKAPNGQVVFPYKNDGTEGYWRWGKDNEGMKALLSNPEAAHWDLCPYDSGITVDGQTERWVPFEKIRSSSHEFGWNTWLDGFGTNADGTSDLKNLFHGKKPFETPKPVKLLEWIVGLYASEDDEVILDVFSGAAGTAEAAIRLSAEDGAKRKFIMVQLDEPCEDGTVAKQMGFNTICEIGEERIRRAGARIAAGIDKENEQLELGAEPKPYPDLGFRVLRIDSSNFKDFYLTPGETAQESLFDFADNVKEGRSDLDLLFEVLPKLGIPYSAKIEERMLAGKKVFFVDGDKLAACFDANVGSDTIEEMAKEKPWYAVIRDSSMADDATHANYEELFRTYSSDTVPQVI